MLRKRYLACAVALLSISSVVHSEAVSNKIILKMDLTQLRKALDSKEITSEQLVSAYLHEINQNDHQGKNIDALMSLKADALALAKQWDKEGRAGKKNPALAGIPFVVKDNYNTKGLATTGGNLALATNKPSTNAFCGTKTS